MLTKFKNPLIILGLIGAVLMLVGSLGNWYSYNNEEETLFKTTLNNELADKANVIMVISFISIVAVALTAILQKRFIPIINILPVIFAFVIIFNQRLNADEKLLTGANLSIFYFMTLIGAIFNTIGSFLSAIYIKGLKSTKQEGAK